MSTVRQQLGGDLLNVHSETANRRGFTNVHSETANRRGFTKCPRSGSNYRRGFITVRQHVGGDLLNVHGLAATRRGFVDGRAARSLT